jgi:hypothetical protein
MEASGCPKKSLHSFTNSISLRQWHLKMSLGVSSSLCGNYQKLPQAFPSNAIQTKKPFWVDLDWIGSRETSTIPLKSKDTWKIQEQVGNKLIWAKCLPQHNLGHNCKIGCLCNFSYWRPISVSFYIFTCMTTYSTIIPYNVSKNWINICQKSSQSQPPAKVTNSSWWLVAESDTAH